MRRIRLSLLAACGLLALWRKMQVDSLADLVRAAAALDVSLVAHA